MNGEQARRLHEESALTDGALGEMPGMIHLATSRTIK
jgi:hypothetical protein